LNIWVEGAALGVQKLNSATLLWFRDIGRDVRKTTISYCVKDGRGAIRVEGKVPATRLDMDRWMKTLPQPWTAANRSHGFCRVNLRLLAATRRGAEGSASIDAAGHCSGEKNNDRIDAIEICDCLRCDFLPECCMASTAIRERRRTLRYRNLLVRQMAQMKNKISALLMEAGVNYNKQRLPKAGYFRELLATIPISMKG
jgi:hypothetical protein